MEETMFEPVFSVGLEMLGAVLTAAFFVADCVRQETAPALRAATACKRSS
jgi:hypothetical protein